MDIYGHTLLHVVTRQRPSSTGHGARRAMAQTMSYNRLCSSCSRPRRVRGYFSLRWHLLVHILNMQSLPCSSQPATWRIQTSVEMFEDDRTQVVRLYGRTIVPSKHSACKFMQICRLPRGIRKDGVCAQACLDLRSALLNFDTKRFVVVGITIVKLEFLILY